MLHLAIGPIDQMYILHRATSAISSRTPILDNSNASELGPYFALPIQILRQLANNGVQSDLIKSHVENEDDVLNLL